MSYRHTISIDVGTTNLKLARFDHQLQFEEEWAYRYQEIRSDGLHYELSWPEMRLAILRGLRELKPESNYRIVLTTAMHSLLLRDDEYQDLTGIVTWADKRGHQELSLIDDAFKEDLYLATGTPIHSMNPFYKLYYHLRQPVWRSVAKIYSIKDLIFEFLTGEWWIDVSNASSSGLYDSQSGQWSELVLDKLQLNLAQLPLVKECHAAAPLLAEFDLGQAEVVIGTSDGVSSSLVYRHFNDYAVLSFGTSHAVRVIADEMRVDLDSMNFSYTIDQQHYLVGYPSNNAGNVLDWICSVYQTNFKELEAIIKTKTPSNLVFLPFLNGERAPLWDEQAVAKFIGLERHHHREDLLMAMVCGVFYNVRHNVENLRALHPFKGIALTGGLTYSKVLVQLLADIVGLPILVPKDNAAERLGTIMLVDDLTIPIAYEEIEPDLNRHQVFNLNFQHYLAELP
ncbi:FGGY-family carbohydrate kinase [Globicatella sanguinis]